MLSRLLAYGRLRTVLRFSRLRVYVMLHGEKVASPDETLFSANGRVRIPLVVCFVSLMVGPE